MLLIAFGTVYLALATAFVGATFVLFARRRDDRQRAAEDVEQMRALRPAHAPMAGGSVLSTQH